MVAYIKKKEQVKTVTSLQLLTWQRCDGIVLKTDKNCNFIYSEM